MSYGIVWYKNDLRTFDHLPLKKASEKYTKLIGVFIFDPSYFDANYQNIARFSEKRKNFLAGCVKSLQKEWENYGAPFLVFYEKTESVMLKLKEQFPDSEIFASNEYGTEELKSIKIAEKFFKVNCFESALLIPINKLPFQIENLPDFFTAYRKKVEYKLAPIHTIKNEPIKAHKIDFKHEDYPSLKSEVIIFKPGSQAGKERVDYYFFDSELVLKYKETRNGLLGSDFSTHFSPWLATGCISAAYIYNKLKDFEDEFESNESTYWVFFELLWRDYFKLSLKKFGRAFFIPQGIANKKIAYRKNEQLFENWTNGKTGVPFIDANMRELKETGFMSNRGRQNVASYLVKDLNLDWRLGAYWFESQLLDYDVSSNWGNWLYVAGIGADPRENRYFNIHKQAGMYDPQALYQKNWLTELRELSVAEIMERNKF